MNVSLYTGKHYLTRNNRAELCDILSPFITDANIVSRHPNGSFLWPDGSALADRAANADFAVLPMSWNYYFGERKIPEALNFIHEAKAAGLPVVTWSRGDFGTTPPVDGIVHLRAAGMRSRRREGEACFPFMLSDPLPNIMKMDGIMERPRGPRPVVGFCGQANGAMWKSVLDVSRTCLRNAGHAMGLTPEDPQPLYPPSLRRTRILDALEKSPDIETHFIRRKKYRGGASTKEERWKTTLEYYGNIRDTDYTVCVRGGGNFSLRLYETLAMGRIPLFIDTDCMLPFDDEIDWKKYVVWVDERDIRHAPRILREFHESLTDDEFRERQHACRALWETALTREAFWSKFLASVLEKNSTRSTNDHTPVMQ